MHAIVRRVGLVVVLLALAPLIARAVQDETALWSWGSEPLDDGARCDVAAVRRANREQLNLLLEELANTSFFRLFRVSVDGECPLDRLLLNKSAVNSSSLENDSSSCSSSSSCSVSPEDDTHSTKDSNVFDHDTGSCSAPDDDGEEGEGGGSCAVTPEQPRIDRTISFFEKRSTSFADRRDDSCDDAESKMWFDICDGLVGSDGQAEQWFNLQLNPERHTGYNGSAVWRAVYDNACHFQDNDVDDDDEGNGGGGGGGGGISANGGRGQSYGELDSQKLQCHEERVLRRLISGMHASINTHIASAYDPPSKKRGTTEWSANPSVFMESVGRHPDRIKNLNFAFVVMLRALGKAAPYLASPEVVYAAGIDASEDQRTARLVSRLLDSHLLSSCGSVFEAFDESLMFNNREEGQRLKQQFKRSFQNISAIFNCVKCQKCRLHGKLQLAGVGTALKILFTPAAALQSGSFRLRREEVVAFFVTLHKFSRAIRLVDILAEAYLSGSRASQGEDIRQQLLQREPQRQSLFENDGGGDDGQSRITTTDVRAAVHAIAEARRSGVIGTEEEETVLLRALLEHETFMTALAGEYAPSAFIRHAKALFMKSGEEPPPPVVVVVVIGSGLAGSTAALSLLRKGENSPALPKLRVVLLERQSFLGGNSVYAASGMNAVDEAARRGGDSPEAFQEDMIRSAGNSTGFSPALARVLTGESEAALNWVRTEIGLPFPKLARLGGHSFPRTHRPEAGMAGAELLYSLLRALKRREGRDLTIRTNARARRLVGCEDSGRIRGVELEDGEIIEADAVVLATGGFASNETMVPEWMRRFGTTNGAFASGDGLIMARECGARAVDLDSIQLHPTAFTARLDSPSDRLRGAQPLCAELLRGVGGILLTPAGERFCNELGTRAEVSAAMMRTGHSEFILLVGEGGAREASHHVPAYVARGLLTNVSSLTQLVSESGMSESAVRATMERYVREASSTSSSSKKDSFGKTVFSNVEDFDEPDGKRFYFGRVQPSRHYVMGGVLIDEGARVMRETGSFENLFATGEVTGGIHGQNRLGGNGMTESVVFGRKASEGVWNYVVSSFSARSNEKRAEDSTTVSSSSSSPTPLRPITREELARHTTANDCWVAVRGRVFDFSGFLSEHPGGADSILRHAGTDATEEYDAIHPAIFLDDFEPKGVLVAE